MFKRMIFTLTVTAIFTGLYCLYALAVTPRLEPPMLTAPLRPFDEHDEPRAEPPPSNREDADRFLSEAPWAARAKFQIRLAKGVLFSESWRPQDESRNVFEFHPFATILFQTPNGGEQNLGNSAEQQPLTLVSEKGLIRFSSPFDPVNQKVSRVIGSKLEGKVTITGPDGLVVHGHDWYFDESTMDLHSDFPVDFTYQQHHGTGEGLKIELLPTTDPPSRNQLLAIGGFKRVILLENVEMDLVSNDGPLHVTSEKGCEFNQGGERNAIFHGNVHVTHHTGRGEPNQLRGEVMTLTFEENSARDPTDTSQSRGDAPAVVRGNGTQSLAGKEPASTQEVGAARSGNSPITLRKLEVTGNRVELNSPSNDLTALMLSLIYDVPSRTATLSALPAEGQTKRPELTSVIVRQKRTGTELSSPYLQLVHDEAGQIVSANGKSGRLRRLSPDTGEIELSAKWKSSFEMKPEPNSELDQLTLVGRAVVEQPTRKTGLKAEQIDLWFDRPTANVAASLPRGGAILNQSDDRESISVALPRGSEAATFTLPQAEIVAANVGATVTANATTPRAVPDLAARGFRPRQLQAQDNVVVVSPQMIGRSKSLTVDFDGESPKPAELASDTRSRRRVRPASTEEDPAANAPKTGTAKNNSGKPSAEPMQLTADRIRATVRLSNGSRNVANGDDTSAELSEVWTEGNVDIQQPRVGDEEPLHLTGEKLHMRNASRDGQQVLHIFGQPAVIRARGFDIEGNEIFFDRPNNRTWIEGAGALRLPVKNDFDGQKLSSPALLTVWWKEKMLFDGQTATFLDNVKAVLNDSRLQCEAMEVVLTEKFLFQNDSGPPPQAEVRRVICKDGVELDHTLYVDKELSEIRRGHFAALKLDQLSGRMDAVGPGEIALWRPGRGKRAALAPRAVAQANRPLESEISNWEFTRVTFFGKTVGNLRERQTMFQDRVHIVYGPVTHPLDTIDPDHLPKDGGDMECDTLQILQRKETANQKAYIELEAKGNAKLEGREFNARADEITFDESKELYTLRAAGNRQVTIWRQTTLNGEPPEFSAKSLRFIPSTNYLYSDRTTGIRSPN